MNPVAGEKIERASMSSMPSFYIVSQPLQRGTGAQRGNRRRRAAGQILQQGDGLGSRDPLEDFERPQRSESLARGGLISDGVEKLPRLLAHLSGDRGVCRIAQGRRCQFAEASKVPRRLLARGVA